MVARLKKAGPVVPVIDLRDQGPPGKRGNCRKSGDDKTSIPKFALSPAPDTGYRFDRRFVFVH